MTRSAFFAAAVAALSLAAGAPARADTVWDWSYTSDFGAQSSGQFATAGDAATPELLLWITGTYRDAGIADTPITGLLPVGPSDIWDFNNLFSAVPPTLDGFGIVFNLDGVGASVNLLYDDVFGYQSIIYIDADYAVTSFGTFTASPAVVGSVPEPGSVLLMLGGLAALGGMARRRAAARPA